MTTLVSMFLLLTLAASAVHDEALRLLNRGLLMIGWTVSFLLLEMRAW